MDKIKAPFTQEQVENLNRFQSLGYVHPFTCGNDKCRAILIATENGWICPECGYEQDWAPSTMAKDYPKIYPTSYVSIKKDFLYSSIRDLIERGVRYGLVRRCGQKREIVKCSDEEAAIEEIVNAVMIELDACLEM